MPINTPVLEAIGIRRQAGGRWLLDDVSVTVRTGQRLALVGPSGSGKTLLLRALAMLDPIDAGEVRWCGSSVLGRDIPRFRSRAIYLHQRPPLLEGTVEDILRGPFTLAVHRQRQFDRRPIVAMLEHLGRDDSFLAKQQRELSGGEAQLVSLLRAIQLEPEMLLLDEPTSALDAESTGQVESLVADWLQQAPGRRASLWVTHNREQAERVADSVRRIQAGRLVGDDDAVR